MQKWCFYFSFHSFFFFSSQKFSFGWWGPRNAQLPFRGWPWQDGLRYIWRRLKCALEQKRITLCHFTTRESRAPEVNGVSKSYCPSVCASLWFHSGRVCECVLGCRVGAVGGGRHVAFVRNSITISPRFLEPFCAACPRSHPHIAPFYLYSVSLFFPRSPASTIPLSNEHLTFIMRNIFIFRRFMRLEILAGSQTWEVIAAALKGHWEEKNKMELNEAIKRCTRQLLDPAPFIMEQHPSALLLTCFVKYLAKCSLVLQM